MVELDAAALGSLMICLIICNHKDESGGCTCRLKQFLIKVLILRQSFGPLIWLCVCYSYAYVCLYNLFLSQSIVSNCF